MLQPGGSRQANGPMQVSGPASDLSGASSALPGLNSVSGSIPDLGTATGALPGLGQATGSLPATGSATGRHLAPRRPTAGRHLAPWAADCRTASGAPGGPTVKDPVPQTGSFAYPAPHGCR